jgi:hypothetical protein
MQGYGYSPYLKNWQSAEQTKAPHYNSFPDLALQKSALTTELVTPQVPQNTRNAYTFHLPAIKGA